MLLLHLHFLQIAAQLPNQPRQQHRLRGSVRAGHKDRIVGVIAAARVGTGPALFATVSDEQWIFPALSMFVL